MNAEAATLPAGVARTFGSERLHALLRSAYDERVSGSGSGDASEGSPEDVRSERLHVPLRSSCDERVSGDASDGSPEDVRSERLHALLRSAYDERVSGSGSGDASDVGRRDDRPRTVFVRAR